MTALDVFLNINSNKAPSPGQSPTKSQASKLNSATLRTDDMRVYQTTKEYQNIVRKKAQQGQGISKSPAFSRFGTSK